MNADNRTMCLSEQLGFCPPGKDEVCLGLTKLWKIWGWMLDFGLCVPMQKAAAKQVSEKLQFGSLGRR